MEQEYPSKMVNAMLAGFLRDRELNQSHAAHGAVHIEELDTKDEKSPCYSMS